MIPWLQLAQALVIAAAGALLFSVRQAFKGGQWFTALDSRIASVEKRLNEGGDINARIVSVEGRMKSGGEKTSDLATEVQGLPERLRKDFVAKDVAKVEWDHFKREISWLQSEVRNLWKNVRKTP